MSATLRVLIEKERGEKQGEYHYTAQCLETGNVAVARDYITVRSIILEILQEEVRFAEKHDNFENLYSSPAPEDVKQRFQNLRKDQIETLPLFPNVNTEVEVARAA
jgi:hypothetical protein